MSGLTCLRDVTLADGQTTTLWMADGRFITPPDGAADAKVINASGAVFLPLAVDLCARLREPGASHKATIASETRAAAAAGVGTLCLPPDTNPVIDQPAVVDWIGDRARGEAAEVKLLGALTQALDGAALADLGALLDAGCVGVAQPRRLPRASLLRQALQYASGLGCTVHLDSVHADLAGQGVAHAGRPAMLAGLTGIPASAEAIGTAVALELARDTGCRVHLGRITSARAIALIATAKQDGVAVTCDVSAHQLFLTDEALSGLDPAYRLDPPLRTEADRLALIQAVTDGTISAICSDHQPQDANAKTDPFPMTEPGGSTVELLVPAVMTLAQTEQWPLERVAQLLVDAPSRILGCESPTTAVGAAASGVLINPLQSPTTAHALRSAGQITPFQDISLTWQVQQAWRAGQPMASA